MKQYMLSVYHADEGPALAPEVMAKSIRDVDAINAEMRPRAPGSSPAACTTTARHRWSA